MGGLVSRLRLRTDWQREALGGCRFDRLRSGHKTSLRDQRHWRGAPRVCPREWTEVGSKETFRSRLIVSSTQADYQQLHTGDPAFGVPKTHPGPSLKLSNERQDRIARPDSRPPEQYCTALTR